MFSRRTALAIFASSIALPAFAAAPQIFQNNGVAINGYDPVAYFSHSQPVQGSFEHRYNWSGATWHFASAANRDLFAASPSEFAPQFGGYCAYAASKNALAPTIPEAWTVYQGKLYLNANLRARDLWSRDKDANIALAIEFWPEILG